VPALDVPYATRVLSNGARVVAVPQPQLHRAHVAFYVRVGSRFEAPETNGISHFLEHMIYRGTERLRSAHAVNFAFERLGGSLYAATQVDYGVFSVSLPPENLEEATALFAEVLLDPAFHDVEIEQGIVCEEILEDLDDEGRQVDADNLSRSLIYPAHPLGYTITGDEARVRSFDPTVLRTHHTRHYRGAGVVVALSGAIDAERALDLAEKHFGRMPAGERVATAPPSHAQKKPRLRLVENVSSQTELRVCLRAIPETDPRRAGLDVLMRLVDDGMSTRLYHRICDAQGLCYDVSAGYDGYEDDGIVDFAAGVVHQRTAKVTGEILAMIDELAQFGPTEEELEKVRNRHRWELSTLRDSAEDLAGFFAGGYLFNRFETPAQRLSRTQHVTQEDVIEVARILAQPSRLNVVAVGLLEDGEDKRLSETVKGWKGFSP
jgi:predicted Zn-dependent peptidase